MKRSWNEIKFSARLFLKGLGFRWGIIACLVILPINILTIIITNMMYSAYQEQLTTAFSRELDIYAESIRSELERTADSLTGMFGSEMMVFLNLGSNGDAVVHTLRLKNEIQHAMYGQIPKMGYIWERDEDIFTGFGDNRTESARTYGYLESYIREQGIKDSFRLNSDILRIDNELLLLAEYHFDHVSFGVGYNVGWILADLYNHYKVDEDSFIYFVGADGSLMGVYSVRGFEFPEEEENISDLKENSNLMVFEGEIDRDRHSIAQVVKRSKIMAGLPAMIRVLYAMSLISLIALPVLFFVAMKMVVRPLKNLCDAMNIVEAGDLSHHVEGGTGSYELDFLYMRFNRMLDELHSLMVNSYEREIEKLQTDAINMRLQVNQHMLLNFLNTIHSLASMGENAQVSEFAQLLMKYFRYVLRQDNGLVTVEEEMSFVRDYLRLQGIRFPECFTTAHCIDEEAMTVRIPQLLIENFVENSIKYGLIMGSEIEILINIRIEDERLLLSVCDTGNGMPKELAEKLGRGEIVEDETGRHIGIWNCHRRLKLYYGEDWLLKITSYLGEGTQVWVELPLEPLQVDEAAQYYQERRNLL